MTPGIDLNCDVGEGVGNESLLFRYISSCNIATGGHAGDTDSMREVVSLAEKYKIRIGAHPSYPDRLHFGRVSRKMDKDEFQSSMANQISALGAVLASSKVSLHHIKAHGALYNDLAPGGPLAMEYLEVLQPYRQTCVIYAPFGSEFYRMAAGQGFRVWEEAFADRAYESDGRLVSRGQPGAVITDPKAAAHQVIQMVRDHRVSCSDGSYYAINPRTICIHGDTPNAIEILKQITESLFGASKAIQK